MEKLKILINIDSFLSDHYAKVDCATKADIVVTDKIKNVELFHIPFDINLFFSNPKRLRD